MDEFAHATHPPALQAYVRLLRRDLLRRIARHTYLFFDILPTAKAGGFLDTDGICLLKCRSYDASPKKVDAPTFKMFFAAFLSRS